MGITLFGGFFCNILYAIICDKFEPSSPKIKPNVCCLQMIFQAILMFCLYTFNPGFWSVMMILATNTFFCTGYFGPSMAIMSACAPQGTKGSTMALNLVFSVLGPLIII